MDGILLVEEFGFLRLSVQAADLYFVSKEIGRSWYHVLARAIGDRKYRPVSPKKVRRNTSLLFIK